MNTSITIGDTTIHQDQHGRFCLNGFHRAAGGEERHRPAEFLRIGSTQELIEELRKDPRYGQDHIAPVEAIRGGPRQGTYVVREIVYAYAMWISPVFHLKVIRAFDAMATGHAPPAFEIPKTYAEALRLAAAQAERLGEQQRQLAAQQPAVEFVASFVEAKATKSIREVAKVLGLKERGFVAQLEADGVLFRQSGRLFPSAEHQHMGLFQVKTGEAANGHVYTQPRFTPAGIAWAAKRYAMGGDNHGSLKAGDE